MSKRPAKPLKSNGTKLCRTGALRIEQTPAQKSAGSTVISLADRLPAKGVSSILRKPIATTDDEKKIIIRVLILQITQNMGLPMTAEQHGFLHLYGHLAP